MRYLEPLLVQVAVSVCILQLKDIVGDLRDGLPSRFADYKLDRHSPVSYDIDLISPLLVVSWRPTASPWWMLMALS